MTCLSLSFSFPARHFGKLYGMVMSISAVFSLLQYPCFALVKGALGGDPFYVGARENLRERAVCPTVVVDGSILKFSACRRVKCVFSSVTGGHCSDSPHSAGVHTSCLRLHPLQESSPPTRGKHPDWHQNG